MSFSLREFLDLSTNKWKRRLNNGRQTKSQKPARLFARLRKKWKKLSKIGSDDTSRGMISLNENNWSGLRLLRTQLESADRNLGLPKLAIGRCIDMIESIPIELRDYEHLGWTIDRLLGDLAEYMNIPMEHTVRKIVEIICLEIKKEAKTIKQKQETSLGGGLDGALDQPGEVAESWRRIGTHLERAKAILSIGVIETRTEMTKVPSSTLPQEFVSSATEDELGRMSPTTSTVYNSAKSENLGQGNCTPGNRKAQIDRLMEWAHEPDAGKTCWFNGAVGTGKSMIVYTICRELETMGE